MEGYTGSYRNISYPGSSELSSKLLEKPLHQRSALQMLLGKDLTGGIPPLPPHGCRAITGEVSAYPRTAIGRAGVEHV